MSRSQVCLERRRAADVRHVGDSGPQASQLADNNRFYFLQSKL